MTNWINTVSRDHVERGVRGRFTQANHGKPDRLRKIARGDWIVFYSPRVVHPDGEPLQAFTAIGQIADDEPYQAEMSPDFHPWRRNVDFLDCAETPIRPLIEQLDFIEDKSRWGYKFRFGAFKIEDRDLEVIRSAMTGCAIRRCAESAAFAGAVADRGVVLPPTTTVGWQCGHACGCRSPSYSGEHIARWGEARQVAVECQLIDVAVQGPG